MRVTFFLTLAILLSMGTFAMSQERHWDTKGPEGFDLKPRQLFSIFTSGRPRNPSAKPIKEFGTGFAVAPQVLITARHVTRDDDVFTNLAKDDRVVIPMRDVELTYAEKETIAAKIKLFRSVAVTQSPQSNTDAARLDLHTDEFVVEPMPLSICKLETNQAYYLLKFQQGINDDGQVLASKNKNEPRAVPLEFEGGVSARRGNLRRFKLQAAMSSEDPAKPVPGDSGGPVIDAAGNVVGLLTALQGDVFLWVTPTENFLDLVPAKVRSQVACSTQVEGSLGFMVGTDKRLDADILNLRSRIERDFAMAEARIARVETAMLAELSETRNKLARADKQLVEAHARLADQNKQLDDLIRETSSLSKKLLEELSFQSQGADIDQDELQNIMDKLRDSAPVVPVMLQMRQDLAGAKWQFWVTPGGSGNGIPSLNILFSREISLPVDYPELIFCMRPMLELNQGVRRKDHKEDDFRSIYFFIDADSTLFNRGLTNCKPYGVKADAPTKQAQYSFPLELSPRVDKTEFSHLSFDGFVGRYFYGYVFEPSAADAAEDDQFGVAPMLHRFLFRAVGNDLSDIECYYFPQEDLGDASETMISFIDETDEQVRKQYKCPTQ